MATKMVAAWSAAFEGWNRPVRHSFGFTSVFLSKFVAFHPQTVKRIVMALMSSLLFRCFSLFLPHLRTLAQEKRSESVLVVGLVGGVSVSIHHEKFFPTLTMAACAKKILAERFARAISVHYQHLEHAYVYWIWLRGSASYMYVIKCDNS